MRTFTTTHTVYTFDELSDNAKQAALEELSYINVDHDWHDSLYDDAKTIGLEITEFDTYRGTIDGKLTDSIRGVCNAIIENHGKDCDTYKLATSYLKAKHDKEEDDLTESFQYDLLQCYLSMLSREYDYMTSKEAIIETIKANEYEFTIDGKLS